VVLCACSGNPCLCGGAPAWLAPVLDAPAAGGNTTANSTNNTTASPAATLAQPCSLAHDTACGVTLWPPEFFQDAQQLLLLKAAAGSNDTMRRLESWRASNPPCTNSTANGTCRLCDESIPLSACGGVYCANMTTCSTTAGNTTFCNTTSSSVTVGNVSVCTNLVPTCNWRFVECRNRRVTSLNMANRVGVALALERWRVHAQRRRSPSLSLRCRLCITGLALHVAAAWPGQWHGADGV
jgi:hypothetical protein